MLPVYCNFLHYQYCHLFPTGTVATKKPAGECFGGKSVAFEAGGKYYVAGWDGLATKAGAEAKCKSVNGILANLDTNAKLAPVG